MRPVAGPHNRSLKKIVLDSSLFLKLIPLYALVALGFVGGKLFDIRSQEIGKILLYFLGPAVIFKGFYQVRSESLLMLPLGVFAVSTGLGFLALWVGRRLWHDGRQNIAAFTAGTGNTGYFGIPACLSLIGPEAFPYVVMFAFGATAYEVSFGFYIVARARATMRTALMRVLAYPGLHACWVGLLLNINGVRLPAYVGETVDFLAGGYSTLGMMIIGLGLASLRRGLPDIGFTAFAFLFKFLVWPVVVFAFVAADRAAFGLFNATAHQVLLIQSLVPLAAMTVVHATLRNVHPDTAALAVGASTLFALFYLPFGLSVAARLL